MIPPETPDRPPSEEAAVERLLTWYREDDTRRRAVLSGGPGSGRTGILVRLARELPRAVTVDATDLTAEEILARVLAGLGVPAASAHRSGWAREIARRGLQDTPVIILNADRSGTTRRSCQVGRVVRALASCLVTRGRLAVVVESDTDVPPGRRHLALTTPPGSGTGGVVVPREARDDVIGALALAEGRRVPLGVWRMLVEATGATGYTEDRLAEVARGASSVLTPDGEWVRFVDERVAEQLRRDHGPDGSRHVHGALLDRLLAAADGWRDPGGWAASGATGQYAARCLAMHAVQAARFDELQRDGRVVAQLRKEGFLDAANCRAEVPGRYARRLGTRTSAGDAANLWLNGAESLGQAEWASWLHLMATARGDGPLAAGIEQSGLALPWRTRWARWRPPGGVDTAYLRPGSITVLDLVDLPGGTAVSGQGEWDGRYHLWSAGTGETLAGPWPGEVPEPGLAEPYWPAGVDTGAAQPWVNLDAVSGPLLPVSLRAGGMVVLAGNGGVVGVEPADPATFQGVADVPGEPFLAAFGNAVETVPDAWEHADRAVLDDVFGPEAVRRVAETDLPRGLRDEDARRVLTSVGLPAFTTAELQLFPADEQPWDELTREEVWGGPDGAADAASAGDGPFYRLGTWYGTPVVLDGTTGAVHCPVPDVGQEPRIAGSLDEFVGILQSYVVLRCTLPLASGIPEREGLRGEIEVLADWYEGDGAFNVWTSPLYETD